MPSPKPKIQGVIQCELYEKFITWKESIAAKSEGHALNQLLSIFFNHPIESITPDKTELADLSEKLNEVLAEINALKEFKVGVQDTIDSLSATLTLILAGSSNNLEQAERQSLTHSEMSEQKVISSDKKEISFDRDFISGDIKNIQNKLNTINMIESEGQTNIEPRQESATGTEVEHCRTNVGNDDDIYSELRIKKPLSLTGVALASRLGVSERAVRNHRDKQNLKEWSRKVDPENKAWIYKNKRYYESVD